MRLIGGRWRRSMLPVPDRPGLRPTPDRVRETLFNWLGQDLTGWRVLDAFAGSGALGFEAASRGAAEVILLESDPAVARGLEASRRRLGGAAMRVVTADAMTWMAARRPGSVPAPSGPAAGPDGAPFDLVLLDPPFDAGLAAPAMALAAPLLAAGGWLYVETGEALAGWPAGFERHRTLTAGAVHATLLRHA